MYETNVFIKRDVLLALIEREIDFERENNNPLPAVSAFKRISKIVQEISGPNTIKIVRCKDCAYRDLSIQCPMCHEEYYDDDGYMESYTVDYSTDEGFCHCGVSMDDVCKEEE